MTRGSEILSYQARFNESAVSHKFNETIHAPISFVWESCFVPVAMLTNCFGRFGLDAPEKTFKTTGLLKCRKKLES